MDAHWLDLLNSDWRDWRGSGPCRDRIDDDAWLDAFLKRWNVKPAAGRGSRRALKRLRSLIRRMAMAYAAGRPIAASDRSALNAVLAGAPVIRRLESSRGGYSISLVPREAGLRPVLADIASSFGEVLEHGEPSRVKVCENADCKWHFYDRSRSRTRRYCDPAGCGNLMKVRRFRARRRKGRSSGS